jgi:hypothetical protein
VIADLPKVTTTVTFSISLSPLKFGPGSEPPSVALAHGERREVITMKRAIIFAFLLMAGLPAVAGIPFADYGPVTDGGIEAPGRLDDVQAP